MNFIDRIQTERLGLRVLFLVVTLGNSFCIHGQMWSMPSDTAIRQSKIYEVTISKVDPDGITAVGRYRYDTSGRLIYRATGKPIDSVGIDVYSYDSLNRITEHLIQWPYGKNFSGTRTKWNGDGSRIQKEFRVVSDTEWVHTITKFDTKDRIVSVQNFTTQGPQITRLYAYNAAGDLSFAYDSGAYRIRVIRPGIEATYTSLSRKDRSVARFHRETYDSAGKIATIYDSIPGGKVSLFRLDSTSEGLLVFSNDSVLTDREMAEWRLHYSVKPQACARPSNIPEQSTIFNCTHDLIKNEDDLPVRDYVFNCDSRQTKVVWYIYAYRPY